MHSAVSDEAIRTAERIRETVAERLSVYMKLTELLVNIDSGEDHPSGIRQVQMELAQRLEKVGARIEWRVESGVPHLRASLQGGRSKVVLLGHADTVFRRGTAEARPFRIEGGNAYGPGVVDMKGCLVMALAILEMLEEDQESRPTIEYVIVGDEETRTVPPPFLDELAESTACLVLECGRPGGGFVVSRKAGIWARVICKGRAAHSGTEPDVGRNAILPLCRETLRVAKLDGSRPGLTLGVGKIVGGTAVNTVPETAEVFLDIRSPRRRDLEFVVEEVKDFGEYSGINFSIEYDDAWPAMEENDNRSLAAKYAVLARKIGIRVSKVRTGGMSDGNWFSDLGIPTIDGLGPIGGLDHGPDEYLVVESIPDRAGLLAGLLVAIGGRVS